MIQQAMILERESLAARETARPPMERPATKPLISKPQKLTTAAMQKQMTRIRRHMEIKFPKVASRLHLPFFVKKEKT